MKLKELIQITKDKLNEKYYLARTLIKYTLNVDENYLTINDDLEISQNIVDKIMKKVNEINSGMPIQYITNSQEFMGEKFYVDENVLIPQPDTEVVVLNAIKIIKEMLNKNEKNNNINVLDLCTGSGIIAISILNYLKEDINKISMYATDISEKALEIAKKNEINILKNSSKINFIKSDMFNNLKDIKFDLIVSNPPYIKTSVIESLSNEVKNEPHIALDGGADGLKFYKIIWNNKDNYLKKDGYIVLEIGFDQRKDVQEIFKNSTCIKDYAGNDRVIIYKNSF